MALITYQAKARLRGREAVPLRDLPRITREALPALLLPVILLGCLYSGVTTPTEAAAVAAAYALLVVGRAVPQPDVATPVQSLVSSARISVSIGMLIAGALVFNYVITSRTFRRA